MASAVTRAIASLAVGAPTLNKSTLFVTIVTVDAAWKLATVCGSPNCFTTSAATAWLCGDSLVVLYLCGRILVGIVHQQD